MRYRWTKECPLSLQSGPGVAETKKPARRSGAEPRRHGTNQRHYRSQRYPSPLPLHGGTRLEHVWIESRAHPANTKGQEGSAGNGGKYKISDDRWQEPPGRAETVPNIHSKRRPTAPPHLHHLHTPLHPLKDKRGALGHRPGELGHQSLGKDLLHGHLVGLAPSHGNARVQVVLLAGAQRHRLEVLLHLHI